MLTEFVVLESKWEAVAIFSPFSRENAPQKPIFRNHMERSVSNYKIR